MPLLTLSELIEPYVPEAQITPHRRTLYAVYKALLWKRRFWLKQEWMTKSSLIILYQDLYPSLSETERHSAPYWTPLKTKVTHTDGNSLLLLVSPIMANPIYFAHLRTCHHSVMLWSWRCWCSRMICRIQKPGTAYQPAITISLLHFQATCQKVQDTQTDWNPRSTILPIQTPQDTRTPGHFLRW